MTVQDIIIERLKFDGFGGLFSPDGECGCALDCLIPGEYCQVQECQPGYKVMCTAKCEHEYGWEPNQDQWHIQADKPEPTA